MAAVFGGSRPLVWEIDPEAVESIRLRATEQIINPIAGALGLANGNLLVAGGSVDKLAYQLDEDLLETWTYVNPSSAPYQGFVGIAAMSGGAVLSANHVSYSAENRYSAFWTIGLATSGASLWDAIEIIEDDDDVYPRDLRALSGDRSVLLSDSAEDNPQFIIYDAVGGEVDNEELPQLTTGVHRILCAGPNGFLLMGSQATLIGFDSAGEPTFSTVYERESTPAEIGAGCSARSDNSPVVATVSAEESQATLEVIGFVGATQAWNTPVAVDALPQTAPEVYIEESLARAWVFIGGTSAVDERIVFAAVLAL
jgi:hypothetical protein